MKAYLKGKAEATDMDSLGNVARGGYERIWTEEIKEFAIQSGTFYILWVCWTN